MPAAAWGPTGHQVTAAIAEAHLTPKAKEAIATILGPGVHLADVSTWADEIKQQRPNTKPWHYIDLEIEDNVTVETEGDYCGRKSCVLDQIKSEIALLKNPSTSSPRKAEALKFLIHFMGDIHMPLHCADDHDGGGNGKKVRFMGRKMALHALWDDLIEKRDPGNAEELAPQLNKEISPTEAMDWAKGTVEDWIFEDYKLAKKTVYPDYHEKFREQGSQIVKLNAGYRDAMQPLVYQQLQKGGIRLATVLNQIFGEGDAPYDLDLGTFR